MHCNLLNFYSHCKFVCLKYLNPLELLLKGWDLSQLQTQTTLPILHREGHWKKMRQHQSIKKLTNWMENPWSKPSITQLVKRHKVWLYHIIVKVASLLIILKIKQTSELTMMVLGLRFDNRQGGLDAFFAAAGTRWTVAGLSRFLQVNLFSLH